MPRERFAERVQRLRWERGLSQRDLAARVRVDRMTVQRWEGEVQYPRLPQTLALAYALGVGIEELLRGVVV